MDSEKNGENQEFYLSNLSWNYKIKNFFNKGKCIKYR